MKGFTERRRGKSGPAQGAAKLRQRGVPSLFLAKDISGYSYDGTYSQGRTTVRPSLRA